MVEGPLEIVLGARDSCKSMSNKPRAVVEYGDFQTPLALAREVCALLRRRGVAPSSVLEPTCGKGHFLAAAGETFGEVRELFGLDINAAHVDAARTLLTGMSGHAEVRVVQGDFFATDWEAILTSLPEPLLIVGNLPWVTNAELGVVGSDNLPIKTNSGNQRGLDAMTGKSNFDISEWMLNRMLDWVRMHETTLAILCKSMVARKVLARAWRHGTSFGTAEMFTINAAAHFGVSVDACLLVVAAPSTTGKLTCDVYESLERDAASRSIGFHSGLLIANMDAFDRCSHLIGGERSRWRSGIKHDCARVMELAEDGGRFSNGLGETVEIEPDCLYPMLKSSDVANGRVEIPRRWMLVTQRHTGDRTETLAVRCPRTWSYLSRHADLLNARASSIYRDRPPFAIFGVGEYSFSPWKIVISGLYKNLRFKVVGPFGGKPIVVDDTCYFYPCNSEDEAVDVCRMLNSPVAQDFFSAFVFWDAKRPVNADLLRLLDVGALASHLGCNDATMHLPPSQTALNV